MLSLRFKALAFFALAATVLATPPQNSSGAIYFMTNNPEENAIVIHNTFGDGTIMYETTVKTGQKGASNVLSPPSADAVRTAGSIVVNADILYNVNPGSNTVSMWQINPEDPTVLHQIGRPVNSGGTFPGTLAVSKKTGRVCVANGGHINGVQCYESTHDGLKVIPNSRRLLNFNQTTPPIQSDTLNSMSTILFSPDETKLVVDVKGLISQKTPGYLAVWDIGADGSLSQNHKTFSAQSSIGALPFGMTYLAGKEGYVASDPSVGGIIFDFSRGYTKDKMRTKNFELPGQTITCWSTYAPKSDSYFLTDFGTQIVFEAKIDSDSLDVQIINQFQLPQNSTLNIDTVVAPMGPDQYLYQLAPYGASIFAFDVQPNGMTKLVQSYNFSSSLDKENVKRSIYSPVGLAFRARA